MHVDYAQLPNRMKYLIDICIHYFLICSVILKIWGISPPETQFDARSARHTFLMHHNFSSFMTNFECVCISVTVLQRIAKHYSITMLP